MQLSRGRGANGWGTTPLAFTEIAAWCSIRSIRLREWELEAILDMDRVLMAHMNRKTDDEVPVEVSDRPLTAELFDAMF